MKLSNDPEPILQWLKSRGEAHGAAAVQAFEERLTGEPFPKLRMSQPFAVQQFLRMALNDFHPHLFQRSWRLFRFDHEYLVTSDNPVGTWSPRAPDEPPAVDRLNATMIVMPLDRRTAVALMDNGADRVVDLSSTSTRAQQINMAVIGEASQRIFHHPDDRPLDGIAIPPRTAFVDEVIGVRIPATARSGSNTVFSSGRSRSNIDSLHRRSSPCRTGEPGTLKVSG
jgi:hypothetical protein